MTSISMRWMGLLLLSGALAAGMPSLVRAQARQAVVLPTAGILARLRRPTLPVPSDGALLFVSDDSTVPSVEVRGSDDARLEGALQIVSDDAPPLYVWRPTQALPLGTLHIVMRHAWDTTLEAQLTVEVVAPFGGGLPELHTEPSATWEARPRELACCTAPDGQTLTNTCFASSQGAFIRVQPGFSSPEPQSVLNQYLFKVIPVAGSVASSPSTTFRPLEHPAQEALFHETADRYCVEVHALSLATLKEEVYQGLPGCAAHHIRELGPDAPAEVNPSSLSVFGCFVPPDSHKAQWCEVNARACEIDDVGACDLYEYNCKGGPRPQAWSGTSGRPFGREADGEGCSVRATRTRSTDGWSIAVMMAAVALTGRRGWRAWLLVACLLSWTAQTVRADSVDASVDLAGARLRRPNLPIPTDGALLFLSDFSPPIVEVRDPEGRVVEGTLNEVGIDTAPLYAWRPLEPLAIGTHEVVVSDDVRETTTHVEVVEPFARGLPALETAPSATLQSFPHTYECCQLPIVLVDSATCFPTHEEVFIRLQPGFLSTASQAVLNQYLFRVVPALGSGTSSSNPVFRPLEHPAHDAQFYEAADSYCVEVHVLSIATMEESVYSGLDGCASHDDRELGHRLPAPLEPRFLAIDNQCVIPPAGFEDEWCTANGSACDAGVTTECEIYQFNCEDGPLPRAWQEPDDNIPWWGDGGTDIADGGPPAGGQDSGPDASNMSDAATDAASDREDGCFVSRPRARSAPNAALGAALALLMLGWRRRAKR